MIKLNPVIHTIQYKYQGIFNYYLLRDGLDKEILFPWNCPCKHCQVILSSCTSVVKVQPLSSREMKSHAENLKHSLSHT